MCVNAHLTAPKIIVTVITARGTDGTIVFIVVKSIFTR